MAFIVKRPGWYLPETAATPESAYQNRRAFLKTMGLGGMIAAGIGCSESDVGAQGPVATAKAPELPPLPEHTVNAAYADAGRDITDETKATTYNNFYEFGLNKGDPARYAKDFHLNPYTLKIDGLVDKPVEMDVEQIEALGFEQRVYRFRCVERWAMTIPWLGVPLRKVLEQAGVKSSAKYVAFKSFYDPEKAPGQKNKSYKWPYYEALRLDEAMNDLAFISTGHYGKRLVPQSGTPLRIVLPWKYGYKGPKSVVQMTLTDKEPPTFWNDANGREYKFYSNIDPKVSHPRWSQARESYLGDATPGGRLGGFRHDTQWYNGYGEQVADLYADLPRKLI